jgi:hypothetical protein
MEERHFTADARQPPFPAVLSPLLNAAARRLSQGKTVEKTDGITGFTGLTGLNGFDTDLFSTTECTTQWSRNPIYEKIGSENTKAPGFFSSAFLCVLCGKVNRRGRRGAQRCELLRLA